VVLLAGGSGASFTFAVALDFITQTKNMRTKAIDFVWVVKEECKPTHPDSCCCTDDFQQI
jgi:phage terminase large subunit